MKGIYFNSNKDYSSHFIITTNVKSEGHNCIVSIFEYFSMAMENNPKTGDVVEVFDEEWFAEINIWNKYYFPTFSEDMQWYHNYDGKEDRIGAISDLLKFALDLGIKEGNIELY